MLLGRCQELHCPELALKVFSDRPKYGLDLSSPAAARLLLHSLHLERPLTDSITLAALYPSYRLPPLASDPVACAMLTIACLRDGSHSARQVGDALLPALKDTLTRVQPWTEPQDKRKQSKERTWLQWALVKIERVLEKSGKEISWSRDWRTKSGLVPQETSGV